MVALNGFDNGQQRKRGRIDSMVFLLIMSERYLFDSIFQAPKNRN